MRFRFTAPLWEWSAQGGWFFVTLPDEYAEDIREVPRMPRGFGAVRVRVTIGGSHWKTSIFPDGGKGCYVLPIKRAVREAEGLDPGDVTTVAVQLMDY